MVDTNEGPPAVEETAARIAVLVVQKSRVQDQPVYHKPMVIS